MSETQHGFSLPKVFRVCQPLLRNSGASSSAGGELVANQLSIKTFAPFLTQKGLVLVDGRVMWVPPLKNNIVEWSFSSHK